MDAKAGGVTPSPFPLPLLFPSLHIASTLLATLHVEVLRVVLPLTSLNCKHMQTHLPNYHQHFPLLLQRTTSSFLAASN